METNASGLLDQAIAMIDTAFIISMALVGLIAATFAVMIVRNAFKNMTNREFRSWRGQ
jgi:hypothetical protein